MKVSVEWLKEYLETNATAEQIGSMLTMLGIELEGIEDSSVGPVLDFKVTPNRGDCLSVLGLARELAAKDNQMFRPTERFRKSIARNQETTSNNDEVIRIENSDLCPRYAAGIFRNVPHGESAKFIQDRITACGMRPISLVVDTTNYVMLELGQPLHAFDLDKLQGKRIVVRTARQGETIRTLDDVERNLRDDMLMICDANVPVAIAGVMGGADTEVSETTKDVLLESAHFDSVSVRRTRRALGMSTEASYRFERYVDPEAVPRAIQRFAELLKQQGGPEMEALHDTGSALKPAQPITVRRERWSTLLGMEVPTASAATILQALGCTVAQENDDLQATPPTWRNDLALEEDLVEEIGRVWGYERIPEASLVGHTTGGGESEDAAFRTAARSAMHRLGFTEIVTHTLCDETPLDDQAERTTLRNPASPELAYLRNTLLPGLALTAAKNKQRSAQYYEVGRVFRKGKEQRSIAFLLHGSLLPDHWSGKDSVEADFFAAKGFVESLCELLSRKVTFTSSKDERLHPTRQAAIEGVGVLGEVKRSIADAMDLPARTYVAEIDLDALFAKPNIQKQYAPLRHFPAVRRDIAVLVSKEIPYMQLESAVRNALPELLEDVWLFDVYSSAPTAQQQSIGIAMLLRHAERTLTDEEANAYREQAMAALEALGAQRRT